MFGTGPAIIVTGESTNVIPPLWSWHIDSAGTLVAAKSFSNETRLSDERPAA
jgi:hypothetical protein